MTHTHRSQRGVVLLVVLSILATLGVLLLQVSLSSREEVAKAKLLLDRTEADLRLRTEESRLQLALLTNPWVNVNPASDDLRAQRWLFDDTPFEVDGVQMQIQDVGGLFVMPQPGYNAGLRFLPILFDRLGIERSAADATASRLSDRLRSTKPLQLQDIGELMGKGGLNRADLERVRAVSTLYPVQRFNFVTAPMNVIESLYQGSNREAMLALRKSGTMNATTVSKVVGEVDPDMSAFTPGPVFRLTLRVRRGDVTVARESTLEIDPYAPEPVKRWSIRRPTQILSVAP